LVCSNSAAASAIGSTNAIPAANEKNGDAQKPQEPEAVAETSTANSKSYLKNLSNYPYVIV
jgi:hypothetical protein